jgi:hypothetical protein
MCRSLNAVVPCPARVRIPAGRQPAAAIIDSQSVKAADTVGKPSRGCDAAKKTEGRKRHLAVDVMGLILAPKRALRGARPSAGTHG